MPVCSSLRARWFRTARKGRRTDRQSLRYRPIVEMLESRLAPATLTVNTTTDGNDGIHLDLRSAITAVNNASTAGLTASQIAQIDQTQSFGTNDTIQFSVPGTILLASNLPQITKSVIVSGPGAVNLIVDGNANQFLPFNITPAAITVTITGVTIANGKNLPGKGGGAIFQDIGSTVMVENCILSGNLAFNGAVSSTAGGAIYNRLATLTVQDSIFSGNKGMGIAEGGAIFNGGGVLMVKNSTFSGNYASSAGGAIAHAAGMATVQNSTLSGNSSVDGGGIYTAGNMTVQNSILSGNSATDSGGGMLVNGFGNTLTVQNSTLYKNSASQYGGGIYLGSESTLTVENSTLSRTSAGLKGGGIANRFAANAHYLTLSSTLIAGNTSTGPDVFGGVNSVSDHNLIGNGTGMTGISNGDANGNQVGVTGSNPNPINPMLGSLQDNGGPAFTMALLLGSPAIDTGSNTQSLTFDQRGSPFLRTVGAGTDVGAFEINPVGLGTLTPTAWTIGQPFPGTIPISGGTGPSDTLTATGLPPGLMAGLDSSGSNVLITGTPTMVGIFSSVQITVQDASGTMASRTYLITINAVPTLGSLAPTQWTVNLPGYPGTIALSGGTGPLTLSAQSGLPPGLMAAITGANITITGTPTTVGTYNNVQLTVMDATGATGSGTYTITINPPVSLGPLSMSQGKLGQPYTATISVSGGTGAYGNLAVTGLPAGLSATLSGNTITLSGTPTVAGAFTLNVTVQDSLGASGTTSVPLAINGPVPPTLVVGADAGALPQVNVYNATTGALQASLYVWPAFFSGGVRVAQLNVGASSPPALIVGAGPGGLPEVKLLNSTTGKVLLDLDVWQPAFSGGVFVAGGVFNGTPEIVVGADAGGGPEVKVFNAVTGALLKDFYAWPQAFSGGVRVAVGDVNGDGVPDIIVGAGAGGLPEVKVFDGNSLALIRDFFAFPQSFGGGVYVLAADLNNDSKADIVVGAAAGALPQVSIFDGVDPSSQQVLTAFYAFPQAFGGGVRVSTAGFNGVTNIVAGAGPGGGPLVSIFDGVTFKQVSSFFAFPQNFAGGVFDG